MLDKSFLAAGCDVISHARAYVKKAYYTSANNCNKECGLWNVKQLRHV